MPSDTESRTSIAVLLPNHNHAHFLPKALDALIAQTRPADEIIVVDDASTDDSLRVIELYAQRLPQLRLIASSANEGVDHATNLALRTARSSHVVCTAADDWLQPDFLKRMAEAVDRFPDAPVYVSAFVEYDEVTDKIVRHDADWELACWFAQDDIRFVSSAELQMLLDERFVWLPVNSAVFARTALNGIGGFDPLLSWHADWFAIYTLALRRGFAVVPEPLTVFRLSDTSFSGRGIRDSKAERGVSMAIFDKLRQPEFRDVYEILARHPAALATTFLRQLLIGLLARPRGWPFLAAVMLWWTGEVARGRRPGILRDFIRSRRKQGEGRIEN